jgi:hypothetical protein
MSTKRVFLHIRTQIRRELFTLLLITFRVERGRVQLMNRTLPMPMGGIRWGCLGLLR